MEDNDKKWFNKITGWLNRKILETDEDKDTHSMITLIEGAYNIIMYHSYLSIEEL